MTLRASGGLLKLRAIISDIHSNFEALTAVLADARSQGANEFFCLGDVVGYGPNPRECLAEVMNFNMVLQGNHDHGALLEPEGFNPSAERAIFWTRDQIEPGPSERPERLAPWRYLQDRKPFFEQHEEGILYVHGSARNPLNEYVFPEDIYNNRKMEQIFARVNRICFQGHTHVPGVFIELAPGGPYDFRSPEELGYSYAIDERKILVNVGSVGQPRDSNPHSCYALLNGSTVTYRRVPYDAEAVRQKIYRIPELENFLGDRLLKGR